MTRTHRDYAVSRQFPPVLRLVWRIHTIDEGTAFSVATSSEPEQLSTLIRRLRLESGLSQEQLAERSGLSVRAVSDLERGQRARTRPETLRMLAEGMGLGDADRELLLQTARPELRQAGAPAPIPVTSNALPMPRSALVGREQDVARVLTALAGDRRPVTLTGPGGVGKTRVAIEAARRIVRDTGTNAQFVDLSPVRNPAQVASAIAQSLGIHESGERSIGETLSLALRHRRLLLILDNFEQIIEAAPLVGELMLGAPDLSVLATSREALRIRDEEEIVLEPLDLPLAGPEIDLDQLGNSASVQLFVAAATEANPAFTLTEEAAGAIAGLCRQLDGLPLAIELAASRVKHFPPAVLLERLDRRLPVLTGGSRDLPVRQQTLRGTIAWSYDLLMSDEQALFRRVGAFPGGASLTALDTFGTVIGALNIDPLSGLASLVDKSLVRERFSAAGTPRFFMLETIREFAGEMVVRAGEREITHDALLAWSLQIARSGRWNALAWPLGPASLQELDEEIDNLRLGFQIAIERQDADACSRLFVETNDYFYRRGLFQEGTAMGQTALALADTHPIPDELRGRVLTELSPFWNTLFDAQTAERLARDGLELAQRASDEPTHTITALSMLVMAVRDQGRYAEALEYAEQADALAVTSDAKSLRALTTFAIGKLSYLLDDQDRAIDSLTQSMQISLAHGAYWFGFHSASCLAAAHVRHGNVVRGASTLRTAVSLWSEAGSIGAGGFLDEAAVLAAGSGLPNIAATLFGANAAQEALFGMREDDDLWTLQAKEGIRAQLGEEAFAAAIEDGRALKMDAAIDVVMELLDEIEAQESNRTGTPVRDDA
jgi:predicted ATPase/transcriptional regulator with XRE-family HTH domain